MCKLCLLENNKCLGLQWKFLFINHAHESFYNSALSSSLYNEPSLGASMNNVV
jgi:hypothetical protein